MDADALADAVADGIADANAVGDAATAAVADADAVVDVRAAAGAVAALVGSDTGGAPDHDSYSASALAHGEELVPVTRSGIIAIPEGARFDTFEIEDDEDDVVIEELEPLVEALVEGGPLETSVRAPLEGAIASAPAANDVRADPPSSTTTALPPAPDDPFTILLTTLADVAMSNGSPQVAALVPALLLDGRLETPLPDEARQALADAHIVEGDVVSDAFARTLAAWRAILRGTSDDFDATGGVMLDEWSAELLARLLGAPARAPIIRRDLRSRGVAAFGIAA